MRIRYEIVMWFQHILKFIPGKIGCYIRNICLPYKNGKNVLIWDGTHIDSPSKLNIGCNVSINRNCTINAGGKIIISNNVLIGPNVIIYSQNHQYHNKNKLIRLQGYSKKSVKIEDNVWIGAKAIILPGVNLGENSIIAAGSVVTKDVKKNTLVAGNPAKTKKFL